MLSNHPCFPLLFHCHDQLLPFERCLWTTVYKHLYSSVVVDDNHFNRLPGQALAHLRRLVARTFLWNLEACIEFRLFERVPCQLALLQRTEQQFQEVAKIAHTGFGLKWHMS